jgi:PPOX class probable F420-dependent enzyme
VSRREQIRMTAGEVLALLDESRVMTCATHGPRGWPHLMPLWYVLRPTGPDDAPELWAWTYAKSQKARNLERDPRATLQVETGVAYEELRGVMLECDAELVRDTDAVTALGLEIFTRYAPDGTALAPEAEAAVRAQASKRVGMRFVERRRATWDHRKLAGVY